MPSCFDFHKDCPRRLIVDEIKRLGERAIGWRIELEFIHMIEVSRDIDQLFRVIMPESKSPTFQQDGQAAEYCGFRGDRLDIDLAIRQSRPARIGQADPHCAEHMMMADRCFLVWRSFAEGDFDLSGVGSGYV